MVEDTYKNMESRKQLLKKSELWKLFNDQGDIYYKQIFIKEKTEKEIINDVELKMISYQNGKGKYLRMFDLFKGTGIKAELVENIECTITKQKNTKTIINNNDCINTKKRIDVSKENVTQMNKRHKIEKEDLEYDTREEINRELVKALIKEMRQRHKLEKAEINKEKQRIRKSQAYIDKIITQKKDYCEVNKLNFIPIHYEEYNF